MSIQISGIEELSGALRELATLDDVKDVVKNNTLEMERKMVRNASFTKGYQTGTTKRSIPPNTTFSDGGFTGKTGPTTEYSMYLERGTRFMSAQPFVGPAFYKQRNIFMINMCVGQFHQINFANINMNIFF